jgi:hypothetical protein
MYVRLHVKYPLSFSDFNETKEFSRQVSEKSKNIKFYKEPSNASSFSVRTDGRTDMTELLDAFHKFSKD